MSLISRTSVPFLGPKLWASLPPAASVPIGTEVSVTDCGGAIAVAGVAGWVFRPIEIFNSNAEVLISGSVGATDQTIFSIPIPAGILGNKGSIESKVGITYSVASGNSKVYRTTLNGTEVGWTSPGSGSRSNIYTQLIRNLSRTKQAALFSYTFDEGGSSFPIPITNFDSTAALTLAMTLRLASAAETATIYGCTATVYPAM